MKQLRIEATADEEIDSLEDAAEECRAADEAYEAARQRKQKAYAVMLLRMMERKRSRYEANRTRLLIKLNCPDPTVTIKALGDGES